MKKIFTLALGLMLTVAMFAADRRPTVTVTSAKKYAIVIDGKRYFSNGNTINISSLYNGRHDIKVYKMKRSGFFINTRRLVASSSFQLRNSDVAINIDRFGQLQISESRFGRGWDRDYGRDSDRDHDHGYGKGDRDGRF
ncbi:MAG TPA: hypothetical protein VGQ53_23235 [Chitinophagaceae bacterium]|jgi:hypothetical protein|nr:hypothetical protein [Chitinophagaceae bacterium]